MTVVYPPWWKGFRWDVERLMWDLFMYPANKAAQDLSGVRVEPFLTTNTDRETWLGQGNALILVHRNGGNIDRSARVWVDRSIVIVAALMHSRDESNELNSYISMVFTELTDGSLIHRSTPHKSGLSTTFMQVPGEVVGPQLQLSPELIRDERMVPAIWNVVTDIPRGLPNYRQLLGFDDPA